MLIFQLNLRIYPQCNQELAMCSYFLGKESYKSHEYCQYLLLKIFFILIPLN